MVASGGLAATNAYGFGHTAKAGYQVLMAAKGEARKTAWKVAGARLGQRLFSFQLGRWGFSRYWNWRALGFTTATTPVAMISGCKAPRGGGMLINVKISAFKSSSIT